MTEGDGRVEEVKLALKSGSASSSTVETLRSLLASNTLVPATKVPEKRETSKASDTTAQSASKRSVKSSASRSKRQALVAIQEDEQRGLTPRAKYALATEVVNVCLKVLTDASKTLAHSEKIGSPRCQGRKPATPRQTQSQSTVTPRVLQPRSGNVTTSVDSEKNSCASGERPPSFRDRNAIVHSAHVVAAGDCAALGFSILRSADPEQLGLRAVPELQIETGMLALISKLIALGLESNAVRELRVLQRLLESQCRSQKKPATTKPSSSTDNNTKERQTLANLVQVDADFESHKRYMSIAINYQLNVMKLLAASRKSGTIKDLAYRLDIESTNSPVNLMLREAKHSGDSAKAAKQLETLSQIIFSLCPSVSSGADGMATDRNQCPDPRTVFSLQVTALRIRLLWWKTANHCPNIEREILEPFSKCGSAFIRRTGRVKNEADVYILLRDGLASLGDHASASAHPMLYSVHNLLCSQAELAHLHEDAFQWAQTMAKDCINLPVNHAKRVASAIKCAHHRHHLGHVLDLGSMSELLEDDLTGNNPDYDILLLVLADIVQSLSASPTSKVDVGAFTHFTNLAASFVLRYARSYPHRSGSQVRTVVETALRQCTSTELLLEWVTDEAAQLFVRDDTLKLVARVAATKPVPVAWTASPAALSMSRILRALLLRTVRADGNTGHPLVFDNEQWEPSERGAVLELQLSCAFDLSPKRKYHSALRKLMPELLQTLSRLYSASEFPIRRARLTSAAFRMRERYPDLLPPELFNPLTEDLNLNAADRSNDCGLTAYSGDLRASLMICKLFAAGRPAFDDLKPALLLWQDLIGGSESTDAIRAKVTDPGMLIDQLQAVVAYFSMRGEHAHCLMVNRMLVTCTSLCDDTSVDSTSTHLQQAAIYLELGYSEKAGATLAEAERMLHCKTGSVLSQLEFKLAYAAYLLAINNLDKCRDTLYEARELRLELPPGQVPRDQRRAYEVLHARSWLVESQYMLELGCPHEALASAKRAVKVVNSIWCSLERQPSKPDTELVPEAPESIEEGIKNLTSGISKLQLRTSEAKHTGDAQNSSSEGARFWPFTPLITDALLHLCNLYAHHGLFHEANYYSERAESIVRAIDSSMLLCRVKSHRSRLLALADRLEDAELSIAKDDSTLDDAVSLAAVELNRAKARIRMKEGLFDEAIASYERVEQILEAMSSVRYPDDVERINTGNRQGSENSRKLTALHEAAKQDFSIGIDSKARTVAGPNRKRIVHSASTKAKGRPQRVTPPALTMSSCYLLSKMKAEVLVEKAHAILSCGRIPDLVSGEIDKACFSTTASLKQRLVRFRTLLQQASFALELDVTLNCIPESTLSIPNVIAADRNHIQASKSSSYVPQERTLTAKISSRATRKKVKVDEPLGALLATARDCLIEGYSTSVRHCGTASSHYEGSMLSIVTFLLSVFSDHCTNQALHPVRAAFALEIPRMKALQFEQMAVSVDQSAAEISEPFLWPGTTERVGQDPVSAANFQQDYVDILPKSWNTVSLSLSEDASELHIARYRSGHVPLVMRLPFSRHKPEADDEDSFDYLKGKAELQDIISLSNYTCHSSGGLQAEGAKTKWWNERKVLDQRLHALLINMESLWFGGFKSVFSLHSAQADLLARFRKSFEGILDRYLPSRKVVKGERNKLSLENAILELFIGLGHDEEGSLDLSESLADLLYFVVDLLLFNGEHNAYDEIDFDGMGVDVLDAVRAYYAACTSRNTNGSHLVLVLDKRLQAFPWENLPCLEETSVSRVGSMLSLRERIVTLRKYQHKWPSHNLPGDGQDCHVVDRQSGTYILNPSSDLTGTQESLFPALSTLNQSSSADWSSIINEEPDEQRFASALRISAVTLYFGHGAGSQYIRPRAIRRLERCSEVVWLMGCSSGAVSEFGELEPCAVPLAYMLAGRREAVNTAAEKSSRDQNDSCMAVVATLWDVTDKDIDRFSLALGEDWGLWGPAEQQKMHVKRPKKPEMTSPPSTPQQAPKTPRMPRVPKTPALARTPARARSRPRDNDGHKRSLTEAVARSRDSCYLRYLNGAAPVVYGVPVYLGN